MLTALDVLGYERPTQLRGDRARLVGLVLPELQNPIFPAFAEVVGGALAQQGFTSVLCTRTVGGVSEADYVDLLLQQQVSGVVFAGGLYAQADAAHEHYERLPSAGCPPSWSTRPSSTSASRRSPATTSSPPRWRWATCGRSATSASAWCSGPADHMPSRRKLDDLRRLRAGHGLSSAGVRRARHVLAGRRARRRGPAGHGGASPASSAPATCSRSARSGPPGARAWRCRATSR